MAKDTRGGKRAGGGSAASAKMPELTGSEKQVKWATELRSGFMAMADANVRNAQKNQKLGLKPDPAVNRPSVEGAKQARKKVVSEFQNVKSASQIIDIRNRLNQQFLEKLATAWDTSQKKKKK